MNMTANCDVTNSAHQIQMTTVCHLNESPNKIFCVRHWLHLAQSAYFRSAKRIASNRAHTRSEVTRALERLKREVSLGQENEQ